MDTANSPQILKFRNSYFSFIEKSRQNLGIKGLNLPLLFLPNVRALNNTNGEYHYAIIGTIQKIDTNNGIIYLKSKGRIFIFTDTLEQSNIDNQLARIKGIFIDENRKLKQVEYLINKNNSDNSTFYSFIWKDERKLSKIFSDYKMNPNKSLNINPSKLLYIIKLIN